MLIVNDESAWGQMDYDKVRMFDATGNTYVVCRMITGDGSVLKEFPASEIFERYEEETWKTKNLLSCVFIK